MALLSGDILDAARLMRLQPVTYRIAQSTIQALTTTETDLAGTSITITTTAANAAYSVAAFFDIDVTTAGVTVAVGRLRVDGVTDTASEAHLSGNAIGRATVSQSWKGTLASAGSHTFILRGSKSLNAAVINSNAGHTSALIKVTEIP